MKVRLGEHNWKDGWETLITRDFNIEISVGRSDRKDIALLRLKEEVDINIYTPICLPAPNQDFTGRNATLAGWGSTSQDGHGVSNILQEVEGLTVISDSECKRIGFAISNEMLCAGGEVGKDNCNGDSGGPLIVEEAGNSYTLIGLSNWRHGDGCGVGYPSGYAEVSSKSSRDVFFHT